MKSLLSVLVIVLAIGVGLYPALYFLVDMSHGLLATKPDHLFQNMLWRIAFDVHIIFGGVALLTGWTQFIERIRQRYLRVHRNIGKTYVLACLFSGVAGFVIAINATGGVIAEAGFAALAVLWLFSTIKAWMHIRSKDIPAHRAWMIRSYALTFAAVTLRLWLPLLDFVVALDFFTAYRISSWLCWVPNLVVAEILVRRATS